MSRSTDVRKLSLWQGRFSRFSRGGVSVESFCAREQVSVASFYYWREKVGKSGEPSRDRLRTDRRSVFQPVAVVPVGPAVRIQLPCGTRIEVGAEDLEVVRAVVGVVARSDHGSDGTC